RDHHERHDHVNDHDGLGVQAVADHPKEGEECRDAVGDERRGVESPLPCRRFDWHGLGGHDGGTRRRAAASISAASLSIGVHLSRAWSPGHPLPVPGGTSSTSAGAAADVCRAAIARPVSTREPSSSTRTTSERWFAAAPTASARLVRVTAYPRLESRNDVTRMNLRSRPATRTRSGCSRLTLLGWGLLSPASSTTAPFR